MFLDTIVLTCFKQLQGQRTNAGVYHLLTGKKSIQTIQDAYIYQLEHFYGIYKSLMKHDFDNIMKKMYSNELLVELSNEKGVLTLSNQGKEWIEQHERKYPVHYFRGIEYNGIADPFYQRLLLFTQTITNTSKRNFSFIPIVDQPAIELWVKKAYRKVKGKESRVLESLYTELTELLRAFPNEHASIFVDRLTGWNHFGMSMNQLAEKYERSISDLSLLLTGIIHRMLTEIIDYSRKYPLLSSMIADLDQQARLTKSAELTYQLWKQNLTIDDIAARRRLKASTIQDHLVEIAFYETAFPLERYAEKEKIEQILQAIQKVNNYKLKDIKQFVDEEISYFQIRLVLAVQNKLMN